MIQLIDLTKRYGKFTAVNGISLEIPAGVLYGLLGPNGAGKTTTMRMIAGILRPTSGSVKVSGFDVLNEPIAARQRLGFIPDRPFVYDKLTGAEFLRFVAGLFFTGAGAESTRVVVSTLSSIFTDCATAFRTIATKTSASDCSIGTVNADAGSSAK